MISALHNLSFPFLAPIFLSIFPFSSYLSQPLIPALSQSHYISNFENVTKKQVLDRPQPAQLGTVGARVQQTRDLLQQLRHRVLRASVLIPRARGSIGLLQHRDSVLSAGSHVEMASRRWHRPLQHYHLFAVGYPERHLRWFWQVALRRMFRTSI